MMDDFLQFLREPIAQRSLLACVMIGFAKLRVICGTHIITFAQQIHNGEQNEAMRHFREPYNSKPIPSFSYLQLTQCDNSTFQNKRSEPLADSLLFCAILQTFIRIFALFDFNLSLLAEEFVDNGEHLSDVHLAADVANRTAANESGVVTDKAPSGRELDFATQKTEGECDSGVYRIALCASMLGVFSFRHAVRATFLSEEGLVGSLREGAGFCNAKD